MSFSKPFYTKRQLPNLVPVPSMRSSGGAGNQTSGAIYRASASFVLKVSFCAGSPANFIRPSCFRSWLNICNAAVTTIYNPVYSSLLPSYRESCVFNLYCFITLDILIRHRTRILKDPWPREENNGKCGLEWAACCIYKLRMFILWL